MKIVIKLQNKYLTKECTWDTDINKALVIHSSLSQVETVIVNTSNKITPSIYATSSHKHYVAMNCEGKFLHKGHVVDDINKAEIINKNQVLERYKQVKLHPVLQDNLENRLRAWGTSTKTTLIPVDIKGIVKSIM